MVVGGKLRKIKYQSIDLSIYLPVCLPVELPACLPVCLSIYLSIYLSIHPSIHPSVHTSIYPSGGGGGGGGGGDLSIDTLLFRIPGSGSNVLPHHLRLRVVAQCLDSRSDETHAIPRFRRLHRHVKDHTATKKNPSL